MAEKIDFHSRAGKKLLKICMGDLYPNPMVVYREYVQNSCDALQEAEKRGMFDATAKKTVSIQIDSNRITIHDRGIGVEANEVVRSLIDLSFSQKNGDAIGRYGVGRLTGAKYCDELVFETSALGESVKSIVRFNAKKARDIIASDEELECTDVVDMVTEYIREEEQELQHYFRVTMNNVFESHLLDENKAKEYLSETVPIDYSPSFKDFVLNTALEENESYLNLYNNLVLCNVSVNGARLKKLYEPVVKNSQNIDEKVGRAKYFKLENEGVILAWGWYSMTVSAKQYINTVPFRKIRLRQLNMAVGDVTYLDNLYKKDADASYFIGEVHIVHHEIEPTTGRDGLVDNKLKKLFEFKLREKFSEIEKEYNALSKFGSQVLEPLATSIRELRILNKEVEAGVKTAEDTKEKKSQLAAKQKEVKDKLANDLTKIKKAGKIDDLIDDIVEYYQDLSDVETEKHNKTKEAQKNNTIVNKVNLAIEIEKQMGESATQNSNAGASETNDSNNPPSGMDFANDDPSSVPAPAPDNKPNSLSELDAYKSLTRLEQSIIRKVYKILDGQKDLAPSIREKLKAKMSKQLTKK